MKILGFNVGGARSLRELPDFEPIFARLDRGEGNASLVQVLSGDHAVVEFLLHTKGSRELYEAVSARLSHDTGHSLSKHTERIVQSMENNPGAAAQLAKNLMLNLRGVMNRIRREDKVLGRLVPEPA